MSRASLWYQDAVVYQLRVRSFRDSSGDGVGDFPGLTEKLGYLRDLGVNTLWILPFYPSPLRDDGYDISDYTSVHPELGTLADFRRFLREAHRHGLRVITELVMNHTSDQHPWFQRARRAPPGSRHRDFYVWSDTDQRYAEARIIFKDFETSNWTWDPVARAYYWHRFYSHQPDLNFDNPAVRRAMFRALDFWLRMGVDGLRLDAIPYLFEREGTSCENLEETHAFLRELRAHVDAHFADRMLLAEANQWPEDATAYFGKGDECHMAFHFPIMPRLFLALHMEDSTPILDILDQTPAIPPTCQWAIFLRNHDELTLEMMTDEERDYMWRVYASDQRARINLGIRRRLAPLLQNNRRRMELMNALLYSLPGTPVMYYGDEIGMGDNIYLGDRNAVRTPMQWSPDRNAGFSSANPQRLFLPVVLDPEYSAESVNVEVQDRNPSSLLWFTRRMLRLRGVFRAFGRGSFEPLHTPNRRVLAFLRRHEDECVLVVVNFSRNPQYVELDLGAFAGRTPIELFGRNAFPRIGQLPYLLTLGPHGFYWFSLETDPRVRLGRGPDEHAALLPLLTTDGPWEDLVRGPERGQLEAALPAALRGRRWFRSKAREIRSVEIVDALRLGPARLTLLHVSYDQGDPEDYVLPLGFALGETEVRQAVARVRVREDEGFVEGHLVDATEDPAFGAALLELVARGRRIRGRSGRLVGVPAGLLRRLGPGFEAPPSAPLRAEQTNTTLRYGDVLVAKLLRRLEDGPSPDLVLNRHLSERAHFPNVPALAGHVELAREGREPATLAILQAWVPNEGDAWTLTVEDVERIFDSVEAEPAREPEAEARIASYAELARLLGQRTGEMHRALATASDDPEVVPELFTPFARRSYAQGVRNLAVRNLDLLEDGLETLPDEATRELARRVLALRDPIEAATRAPAELSDGGRLIRCHGDYHLGQVLYTGGDFVILDFEGEPARPLNERRRRRSPLADVAGMLRSFHYAAEFALAGEADEKRPRLRPEDRSHLDAWVRRWLRSARSAFLGSYFGAVEGTHLLPVGAAADRLLRVQELEKALYELGYELNNRPHWVAIPLRGLLDLLEGGGTP